MKKAGYNDEAEAGLFCTYHALVHLKDYGVPQEKIGETTNQFIIQSWPCLAPSDVYVSEH